GRLRSVCVVAIAASPAPASRPLWWSPPLPTKWRLSFGISVGTLRRPLLPPLLLEDRAALAAVKVALRRLRRWPAANLDHGCVASRNDIAGLDKETVSLVEQTNLY